MKKVNFICCLFTVLFFAANASAFDFGKIVKDVAKDAAKETAKETVKEVKKEAKKEVMKKVGKIYDEEEDEEEEKTVETKKSAKPASNLTSPSSYIATPAKAPAVQQNIIVNVAIIGTEVDAEPAVVKEFKSSELRYMTQEIRRQAINNLPKPKFSIIAEQSQESVVSQKCADKNCWVSLGEKIGADFIARGIIGKFRKNYTFNVEVYDARSGTLVTSSNPVGNEKVENLLSSFYEIAPGFFKKFEDEVKRIEGELSGSRKVASAPPKQAPVTCKTEVDKAKSIYDGCVKIDRASGSYVKCAEDYKKQKEKAEQICQTNGGSNYNISQQSNDFGTLCTGEFDNINKICHFGKIYKIVKIGNQTWMAENVNYKAGTSACYQNSESNCQKCGRLYDLETAKNVCPAGWHLPRDAEWTALESVVGGSSTAGTALKSKNGWNGNGNGTDKYGFSALPCGYGYSGGDSFGSFGLSAYFWSATENDSRLLFANSADMGKDENYESGLYSVRCVRD